MRTANTRRFTFLQRNVIRNDFPTARHGVSTQTHTQTMTPQFTNVTHAETSAREERCLKCVCALMPYQKHVTKWYSVCMDAGDAAATATVAASHLCDRIISRDEVKESSILLWHWKHNTATASERQTSENTRYRFRAHIHSRTVHTLALPVAAWCASASISNFQDLNGKWNLLFNTSCGYAARSVRANNSLGMATFLFRSAFIHWI